MKYTKPPLTFSQQAELLIARGLKADKTELEAFISNVNYYRFSGYLFPYRSGVGDNYIPGTTLDQVRKIYYFDSELRLLTLSAIELIEIAILRTRMVEKFTLSCGAFCYTDIGNFDPKITVTGHQNLMDKIERNVDRSKEEFVNLHRAKYNSEAYLPFWKVAETCTFGLLSLVFRYLPHNVKVPIANQVNLHSRDLGSWLHSLTVVRNICAHHSRLWNRILPVKPSIPSLRHHPEFYNPNKIGNDSYFVVLAILEYLMKSINLSMSIKGDFLNLLSKYPSVPINKMGFPKNWRDYSIFR